MKHLIILIIIANMYCGTGKYDDYQFNAEYIEWVSPKWYANAIMIRLWNNGGGVPYETVIQCKNKRSMEKAMNRYERAMNKLWKSQ